MALTLDPATKVISVPQADLTLVSGTLYDLDTDQFRKDVWDLLSSEPYIWLPVAFTHNTEVTVAGVTFARTLEFINGYSIQFTPDSQWTVRLNGSNNNIFDVENGILVQNQVQVIAQNSAGLQTVITGSGVTTQDKEDIKNLIYDEVIENSETFIEALRLIRADAAGTIEKVGDIHRLKSADGLIDRITATANAEGRTVSATDGS